MDNINGRRLLNIIKKAGKEATDNSKPLAIYVGKVIDTSPLEVQLTSEGYTIDSDFITFPRGFGDIELGDTLLMLREQGGQRFFVLYFL